MEKNNDWALGLIPMMILLGFILVPIFTHINIHKKQTIAKHFVGITPDKVCDREALQAVRFIISH
jgi:hypothetical protein